MTAEITLKCDGRPGADSRFGHCRSVGTATYPWQRRTATRLRLALRGLWHRTSDGRDICPDCWADGCYRDGVPSARWCPECHMRRPCLCPGNDPNPMFLHDEDPDAPWSGDPSTAPDSAKAFIGLAHDHSDAPGADHA